MHKIDAYVNNMNKPTAKFRPLPIKRDWINQHTYNCHPIGMANMLGYGVYFDHDISFMWDGSLVDGAVGIIGKENVWVGRGEGTVEGETRGRDSDDIFNPKNHSLDFFENEKENN